MTQTRFIYLWTKTEGTFNECKVICSFIDGQITRMQTVSYAMTLISHNSGRLLTSLKGLAP